MIREKKADPRHQRGQIAEELVQDKLSNTGLRLITRNFLCRLGEIDLIFQDHKEIVFVEVRARSNTNFAYPVETVGYRKQRKIILTAEFFLQKFSQYANKPCRFDVVGVDFSSSPPHIEWIKGAFAGF